MIVVSYNSWERLSLPVHTYIWSFEFHAFSFLHLFSLIAIENVFKKLHYGLAVKQSYFVYRGTQKQSSLPRIWSEWSKQLLLKNDRKSVLSCKTTAKCFMGPQKGRVPQVDEIVVLLLRKGQNDCQSHMKQENTRGMLTETWQTIL